MFISTTMPALLHIYQILFRARNLDFLSQSFMIFLNIRYINLINNTKNFQNYIGPYPNSEKETQYLIKLTEKVKPDLTISYHSKGEEIYYDFFQNEKDKQRDEEIAKIIAKTTKYKIKSMSKYSAGGYKDWCIQKLKIPAFTIEVGNDNFSHPLGLDKLQPIYKQNKLVIKNILKHMAEEY